MNMESFEIKAELVNRVKQINEQIETLSLIGDGLCNKKHCEIGIDLRLVDTVKKEAEEADTDTSNPYGISITSSLFFTRNITDESKYTDKTSIELSDLSAIRLVGFMIGELEQERKEIITQLQAE